MKLNLLLIGAIAVLSAGIAQAKECKGVNFPEQIRVDDNSLVSGLLGGACG